MKPKISKKWMKVANFSKRFAKDWKHLDLDYSDEAALAVYNHETFGKPMPKTDKINGFELARKWMDVTVAMWKEDIADHLLFVDELDDVPDWFLKKVKIK